MRKGFFLVFLANFYIGSLLAAELNAVNFWQEGDFSYLELTFDQDNINVVKTENTEDRQIFLDLADVSAMPRVIREFDTSQFSGGAIFVRAYPQVDNGKNLRIAVQLRENVGSRITKDTNKVTLVLENRFGPLVQDENEESRVAINDLDSELDLELDQIEMEQDMALSSSDPSATLNQNTTGNGNTANTGRTTTPKSSSGKTPNNSLKASANATPKSGAISNTNTTTGTSTSTSTAAVTPQVNYLGPHVPKSDSLEDILYNITLSGEKMYAGKKITINIKDTPVENVLTMLADSSGFNIITSAKVKQLPNLTLYLVNTPWDQILDIIIELNNLVVKKNGPILMVQTFEEASTEKKAKLDAEKLQEDRGPVVTKIFPISFATLADLTKIMEGYLSPQGKVTEDKRTNSLIVKDSPEVIERLRRIVETLDTQTPQILIESKIVEVNESYKAEMGLANTTGIFGSSKPIDGLPAEQDGFSFSTTGQDGNILNFGIATLGSLVNLNFALQLMETESKGRIIATPKVVAQNNKEAVISTNERRNYAKVTQDAATDTITRDFDSVNAAMDLKVTPQVTNEGSIILDVDLKKDHFTGQIMDGAPFDTATRSIKTNVLVDNGSTIVLGGVYSYQEQETIAGIPFLKDIPIVGWLFRNKVAPSRDKVELIIFITPRILNQQNAGLVTNVEEEFEA